VIQKCVPVKRTSIGFKRTTGCPEGVRCVWAEISSVSIYEVKLKTEELVISEK
jgi:hypothetical protein